MKKYRSVRKIDKQSFFLSCTLVLIAVLYIPVFNNSLTNWDDNLYVLSNPYLRSLSWNNFKNIFTVFYVGNYHPFTIISLAIDYHIGGIRPWPYQLTNILLHLCNTLLVYIFVKSLLQKFSIVNKNYSVIALVAAGLFGIHTFQVESVAWVSERKNLLYSLFFLLSIITYVKYVFEKSNRNYILSVVFFLMSLLSKGMAVPLSVCVILIDYYAGRKLLSKNVILEKIPYLVISLAFGIVAIKAQTSMEAIRVLNNFTWLDRIALAGYGFIQYLVKLCYPYHLSAFYPYPVKTATFLPFQFYVCIVFAVLLLFILWRFFRHNKEVVFGALFFIANISIVIQLLPVGGSIMADRYVYIPSIGFFIIIGCVINNIFQRNNFFKYSTIVLLTFYIALLCVKTYQRIGIWKDSLTLWNDALKKFPENNDTGYLNRGSVLYNMGEYSLAMQDYKKLLEIDPHNGGAYVGTGLIKRAMKDMQGAMIDFNKALTLGQLYDGYLNRAVLKIDLKDFKGALDDLDNASKTNSSSTEIYLNKGLVLFQMGNYQEALDSYNHALEIDSQESKAYRGRGQVKQSMNDMPGAMADYNIAISLYQSYDYYLNRALLKYMLNDFESALADLDNASNLNADAYEVYFDKGFINLHIGNMKMAISEFDKAIKLNTSDFEVYLKRAIAKYNLGEYKEALVDIQQSIDLKPSADAFYFRGMANIQLGRKSNGCNDLKQSLQMGNNDAKEACQQNCK